MAITKKETLDKFKRKFGGFFDKTSDYDVNGVKNSMEQFLSNSFDTIRNETLKEVDKEIEKSWKEDLEASGGHKLHTQALIDRINNLKTK